MPYLLNSRYVTFTYDGWRLARRSLGEGRCIEETDHNDSDELRARYIHGGTYIDELIREDRDRTSDGDFVDAQDYNLYVCQDALYNVVALTELDGDRLEQKGDRGAVEKPPMDVLMWHRRPRL